MKYFIPEGKRMWLYKENGTTDAGDIRYSVDSEQKKTKRDVTYTDKDIVNYDAKLGGDMTARRHFFFLLPDNPEGYIYTAYLKRDVVMLNDRLHMTAKVFYLFKILHEELQKAKLGDIPITVFAKLTGDDVPVGLGEMGQELSDAFEIALNRLEKEYNEPEVG